MIYLDHAATTPLRPGVADAMAPYLGSVMGNPSGVHEISRQAKNALEDARDLIASRLGAEPAEIVFTSGGSESNNLAVKGAVFNHVARTDVVTVATEHDSVLEPALAMRRRGSSVSLAAVDAEGRLDPEAVAALVGPHTSLVSLMWANSETGVIHDVGQVAAVVKARDSGVLVHCDAVQAFNSEPVDVADVDLMSLAAHKFGGPKGVGVLFVRSGVPLEPLIHGGGHELGRRSGTQNVAGAVGLARAMELAVEDRERFVGVVGGIRDDFEKRVRTAVPGAIVNGAARTPQHLNITLPGVSNQALLLRLDRAGVAASAGSACQSGAAKVSHVLEAMGRTPEVARNTVRFSFGWDSTVEEGFEAARIVSELTQELR